MNLPEYERVIYKYNPIIEVICQLRFPTILKIAHQEPVEFQDEIRNQYPLFEDSHSQIPSDFTQVIQKFGLPIDYSERSYSFKSEDEKWQLSITKDFIALMTSEYERYEQFKNRLQVALEIFERIYKPSYYSRIGLRYQDLIIPSKLGLQNKNWSDLIAQHIASELYDPILSSSIQGFSKNLVLNLDDSLVIFKHGFVTVKDVEKNIDEIAYLFDTDLYTEKKVNKDDSIWNILEQFNKYSGKLFRWSITETLHHAMQPQKIASITVESP